MIRNLVLAAAIASAPLLAVQAQPAPSPGDTHAFIFKAAQTDEFERREGRLAENRARDPAVRRFAAQMVSDHTRTTEGLKAAIRRAGMAPPPPPALSSDQQRMMSDLGAKNGRDFDRTYIDQQVRVHEAAQGVIGGYAQSGPRGPIREVARQTLPIVQHHLGMAQDLQRRLGG
ncbi:MAG TPA: DUF4142 domain-containing protein [Caulobacteraceae bacterium]|nr:DUF4142 domain-containing protein [Caulobacteraceae bacterium]